MFFGRYMIEFEITPNISIVATFLLGLLVGSFLNVVIYRLPIMINRDLQESISNDALSHKFNLCFPRSTCPICDHQIRAIENIPILSYLALRGKCSSCHSKISFKYPFIELLTGILSAIVCYTHGFDNSLLFSLIFTWSLIALAFIDFETKLLPDMITQPLLWIGLIANMNNTFVQINEAVIGAIVGYTSLWSINFLYKSLRRIEGIGQGDFKLLAAIGAWLGWHAVPIILFLASLIGAIFGMLMIKSKGFTKNQEIPFGPFLISSAWPLLALDMNITISLHKLPI